MWNRVPRRARNDGHIEFIGASSMAHHPAKRRSRIGFPLAFTRQADTPDGAFPLREEAWTRQFGLETQSRQGYD